MADLLVNHLKIKSEEHSALQSLFSQWDFDRKLIPKALQTVGNLFPHYSRHDESHSRQILVNIERLLGDNLKLLTATDTWLLLESAYWHDIGMVVPQRDLEEALADPEFDVFLNSIISQPHHELHALASTLKVSSGSYQIFSDGAPLAAVSRFRELMAEWFRRKHPRRAEKIVQSPQDGAGINSPRTELIPARLFGVLGRICRMHGASFEAIMGQGGLPFREAGLARDDCHPRFVACLLRLGDLLDLDDNRFCPVMQGIAGEDRPALSKAHEDKHAGVQHLRIDQERIAVETECQTVDGYLEAFRWFGWLKKEIQDQMSYWRDIVPNRELGLLPMLGPVSVRLAGNLKILKDGERPAFTLDAQKAIELLQGNNLYDNEYACIRELLQNAVDATLLKVWLTHRKASDPDVWIRPDSLTVKALLASEPIFVELVESTGVGASGDEKSSWTLTIRDTGTGISSDDLQYMLRIGGSQRNAKRRREIDLMPEWMKPSGAFGIGFQSIFMLCDQVSLKTKSLVSNEIFEVTMYSPTGNKEGLVVLRQLDDDISMPPGTAVTLTFEQDKFAKSWSIPQQDNGSIVFQIIDSLDPVLDDRFPYAAAKLADQVSVFGRHSLIPIKGTLQTLSDSHSIRAEKFNEVNEDATNLWRFIKTDYADVKLRYWPNVGGHPMNALQAFYRGQKFEAKNIYFPNVSVEIDLMSGPAGSWLNFSRDKISTTAREKLEGTILAALEIAVNEDISAADANAPRAGYWDAQSAEYSFFLKSMAVQFGGEWKKYADRLGDAWLDIEWGGRGEPLRGLFERSEWVVGLMDTGDEEPIGHCDVVISESHDFKIKIAATEWLRGSGKSLQVVGNEAVLERSNAFIGPETLRGRSSRAQVARNLLRNRFKFSDQPSPPYDRAAFATALAEMVGKTLGNQRVIAHLDAPFDALALQPEIKLFARSLFSLAASSKKTVLLPFLFLGSARENGKKIEVSSEQIEKLCLWVHPRLNRQIEINEVRRLYMELITWVDEEVMRPTMFWEKWSLARGLVRIQTKP